MLNYNPSTVPIFQSEDYNQFTFIIGNRPLNHNKIKKIIAEIEKGNNMLKYYPIQVKVFEEKFRILDGQHRFFISQRLKLPVYFIIVNEEKSMQDIANVNSNVEKWKDMDFINCYITAGNNNYLQLKNFLVEFDFAVGVCLSLLMVGVPGSANGSIKGLTELFQQGAFEVKYWDQAVEFASKVKLFKTFKHCRSRSFVITIHRVLEAGKVDIYDLAKAYEKNPGMLKEQANFKDYIINLEQIINVGKHNRVIIS